MTTATTGRKSGTAETTDAQDYSRGVTDSTLGHVCSRFLELRSRMECLDKEIEQCAIELGRCNTAIANHLGPLPCPLVLNHQGMWLVINVAEGLLKPGLVTATVTEAMGPDSVLIDAQG